MSSLPAYRRLCRGWLPGLLLLSGACFAEVSAESQSQEAAPLEQAEQLLPATGLQSTEPSAAAAPETASAAAVSSAALKEPAAQPTVRVNGLASLVSVFGGLLFILAIIFALAWLVKRVGQGNMLAGNHLRIVASLPLGTRERLALVEVGGKQILLGMTQQSINTLHVFDEPVVIAGEAGSVSDFALKLRSFLKPEDNRAPTTQEKSV